MTNLASSIASPIESSTRSAAKKSADLVQVFKDIDLKSVGRYYVVMNLVNDLLRDEQQRELGMELMRKAWQAFPNDRAAMLGNVQQEEMWKLPEVFQMARRVFADRCRNPQRSVGRLTREQLLPRRDGSRGLLPHAERARRNRQT